MCGIFGWIKPRPSAGQGMNLDRLTKAGMLQTLTRGRDATGVYTPSLGIIKEAVIASKFTFPKVSEERFFIGHCRAASIGSSFDPLNAHPFECGDFVVVHNGTIRDIKPLPEYDYEGTTDSEILTSYIHKYGVKGGIEKSAAMGALVIYDAGSNRIYFWSNTARPLEICRWRGMIFFASTREILRDALKIDKVHGLFDDANWYRCGERELLCFDMRHGINKFKTIGITKESVPVINVHKTYNYGSSYTPYTPPTRKPASSCELPWPDAPRRNVERGNRFRSGPLNPPSRDDDDDEAVSRFRQGW